MRLLICIFCALLYSCKPGEQKDKEYVTPEEEKVIKEMEKNYRK